VVETGESVTKSPRSIRKRLLVWAVAVFLLLNVYVSSFPVVIFVAYRIGDPVNTVARTVYAPMLLLLQQGDFPGRRQYMQYVAWWEGHLIRWTR
jgi:hypothetical protein